MPTTSQAQAVTRVCTGCFQDLAITEFRRESIETTKRSSRCRSCHNLAERLRRSRARRHLSRQEMAALLTKVRNESDNARVVALCDQMTRRFGGVDGFARVWEACLARDLDKGGFAAFRHLVTVVRLAQFCEQTRASPESMTEEELEAAIRSLGGEGDIG